MCDGCWSAKKKKRKKRNEHNHAPGHFHTVRHAADVSAIVRAPFVDYPTIPLAPAMP